MKKRLLCALLVGALCIGEVFPAAAAVTEETAAKANDTQIAEVTLEDAAPEETGGESVIGQESAGQQPAEDTDEVGQEQNGEQQDKEPASEKPEETPAADTEKQQAAAVVTEDPQPAADDSVVSEQAVQTEVSDEEIEAQGAAAYASPVSFPLSFSLGVEAKVVFQLDAGKDYEFYVYQGNSQLIMNRFKTGSLAAGERYVTETLTLPFASKSTYPTGAYEFVIKESGASEESYRAKFDIARSINPSENSELVTKPTVVESSVVYTGSNITPQITIVDKVGGRNVTLVQGKDFKVTVAPENTKEIGKAKATLEGIGNYSGKFELEYYIRPKAPDLPTVSCVSDKSIKVAWNKIDAAKGYKVFRKKASDKSYVQIVQVNGADETAYTDSNGLVAGETYQYYVTAFAGDNVDSIGNTAGSSIVMTTAAPKLKTATSINTTSIQLGWEKVSGAGGYNVYQKKANGTLKKIKSVAKSKNTYKVTKLKCGTTYNFLVRAYVLGKDGKTQLESVDSNVLKVQAKPATPTVKSATSLSSKKVEIKWKKVSDCSGYIVYKRVSGDSDASWKKVATVKGKSTLSAIDKKAKPGVKYTYTVLAYKTVGSKKIKGGMNTTGKKVKAVCEAPVVVITRIKPDNNEIVINNVKDADGYYIYRKTGNEAFKKIKTIPATKLEQTVWFDTPVDSSYLYTYYVQPYMVVDDNTVKGKKTGNIVEVRLKATTKK